MPRSAEWAGCNSCARRSAIFAPPHSLSCCACPVKLNGNRTVNGTLRGFDQFMNLVLDETMELVRAACLPTVRTHAPQCMDALAEEFRMVDCIMGARQTPQCRHWVQRVCGCSATCTRLSASCIATCGAGLCVRAEQHRDGCDPRQFNCNDRGAGEVVGLSTLSMSTCRHGAGAVRALSGSRARTSHLPAAIVSRCPLRPWALFVPLPNPCKQTTQRNRTLHRVYIPRTVYDILHLPACLCVHWPMALRVIDRTIGILW